jgi:hypothetical protein
MYLLNKTTDYLIIVLTVAASMAVQSIWPVDLSNDSFSVTLSVSKKRKKSESYSSAVLAKCKRSDDSCAGSNDSSIVYVHVKKRKKTRGTTKKMKTTKPMDLVSSQQPSSSGVDEDEMTVVDNLVVVSTVSLEVKNQDLPESADFCKAKAKAQEEEEDDVSEGHPMRDLSQNLLEDNEE